MLELKIIIMRKKEKQLNKLMWQMTAGEFLDLLKECFKSDTPQMESQPIAPKKEKRFVHGIQGIAGLFNCSLATANRIKSSGKIDEAITQVGRKIVVDADLALELARESTWQNKRGRR